jgi:putative membrane protein
MTTPAYIDHSTTKLTLSDKLALERTSLANERTLLAYVRTMIGLIAVGATVIKFSSGMIMTVIGVSLLISGSALLVIGFTRYLRLSFFLHQASLVATDNNSLAKDSAHYVFYLILNRIPFAKAKLPH